MYYNNIECEVISKINEYESVIEIDTGTESYQEEFGIYEEPISRKLIVDNKHITKEKITSSSIILEKEKMLSEITNIKNEKVKEANIVIRNEKKELENQLKEIKSKLTKFDGMIEFYKFVNNDYKYFLSNSGINQLKIVSKDEMLLYKDGRDTKEKAVGFKCILIEDKDTKRYTGKFKIGMEVYRYSDGSGGANFIQGFETLKDAISAYKDYLGTNINVNSYDVATCKMYNIVNEKVTNFDNIMKNRQKENNEKEIERLEANLERLKNA